MNDNTIEISAKINATAIAKALKIERTKTAQVTRKGDICGDVLVRAKGLSGFGKYAVSLESEVHANGGDRWNDIVSEVIEVYGHNKPVSFMIDEIPQYGGRNSEYGRAEEYLTILSRSYTVRLNGGDCDYFSAIMSAYGIVLPTVTDYETAEKVCRIANRLFSRKETPTEVFGTSASDKQAQRIKTLEATQERLLKEIKELTAALNAK